MLTTGPHASGWICGTRQEATVGFQYDMIMQEAHALH